MNADWDRVWDAFVVAVERLDEGTRPEVRGFRSTLDRSANDAFPLRALVSYSPLDASADEHLVVSVDFNREGKNVVGRADLARGDGQVLADELILPAVAESEIHASTVPLDEAARALMSFVERQQPTVIAELSRTRSRPTD